MKSTYVLAPVPLDSFNVTYLMECHPHSPTSNSVVDYSPIYLHGRSIDIFLDGLLYTCIYHEILTMDITEILSTINPSVWETLPLVVLEILSTVSRPRPLSLAALDPLLSYRN